MNGCTFKLVKEKQVTRQKNNKRNMTSTMFVFFYIMKLGWLVGQIPVKDEQMQKHQDEMQFFSALSG